jgi:hypothetical protein
VCWAIEFSYSINLASLKSGQHTVVTLSDVWLGTTEKREQQALCFLAGFAFAVLYFLGAP